MSAAAQRDYALVGAEVRLLRANGVNTDVDLALFEANHGSAAARGRARPPGLAGGAERPLGRRALLGPEPGGPRRGGAALLARGDAARLARSVLPLPRRDRRPARRAARRRARATLSRAARPEPPLQRRSTRRGRGGRWRRCDEGRALDPRRAAGGGAARHRRWLAPSPASAHPLGNFTINHLSQVRISSDRVEVHYILDQAEIPTFQERQRFDSDGSGAIEGPERRRAARATSWRRSARVSSFAPAGAGCRSAPRATRPSASRRGRPASA